jgi:hypothetical protein
VGVEVAVGAEVGAGVGASDAGGSVAGGSVAVGSWGVGSWGVGVGGGVVGSAVGVRDGDSVAPGVAVGPVESVAAGGGVGVAEAIWVGSLSVEGVEVGAAVGAGVGVGIGAGVEASDWGTGLDWTNQSDLLSLVSCVLPADPPGSRSMLDFAGGAGAAEPSTYALAAVPQPTVSTTVPSARRSATAPPSAASPPEYVASASGAYIPTELATSKCPPGTTGRGEAKTVLRVIVAPEALT